MSRKYFLSVIFLIGVLVVGGVYFLFVKFKCGDGTFHGGCSVNKPYFCNDYLVARASVCGCPENFKVQGDECFSEYATGEKNIQLSYEEGVIDFVVYRGVVGYLESLPNEISGELPSRQDFKVRDINEVLQREFLLSLVVEIQNRAWSKKKQAELAISLVQNIPYGLSNKKDFFMGKEVVYSRLPYEVLYDHKGICGERSELLAFLLKELGYETAIFYYGDENHEAVGVKCGFLDYKDTGYCYIETTTLDLELDAEPEVIKISGGRGF